MNFSGNIFFVVELRNYAFREFQVMQKNFVCSVVVVFGFEFSQDFESEFEGDLRKGKKKIDLKLFQFRANRKVCIL